MYAPLRSLCATSRVFGNTVYICTIESCVDFIIDAMIWVKCHNRIKIEDGKHFSNIYWSDFSWSVCRVSLLCIYEKIFCCTHTHIKCIYTYSSSIIPLAKFRTFLLLHIAVCVVYSLHYNAPVVISTDHHYTYIYDDENYKLLPWKK